MELLDLVNDADQVTGLAARTFVHKAGLQHRGVHVFLNLPDGRMLVQKRSADRSSAPSHWDGSVSEHLRTGETYLEGAVRGLWEELGLGGIVLAPLVTFRMQYGPRDYEICRLFQGGLAHPEKVRFDPVEIAAIDYLHPHEILQKIETGALPFCGWFVEIMRWQTGRSSALSVIETFPPQA